MDLASLQVPPDGLAVYCDPDTLGFETTEEVSPLEGTVGQDRAIKALEFGLSIDAPGYNIYVAGYPGTGRTTTLASFLKQTAAQRDVPNDWCYVPNFRDPLKPVAVSLPPGMGRALARDIEAAIADCRRDIPRAFEGDAYRERVEEAMREVQQQKEAIARDIESEAKDLGFQIESSPTGIGTAPLEDGQPINREQYQLLSDGEKETLRRANEKLQEFISQRLGKLRGIEREALDPRVRGT